MAITDLPGRASMNCILSSAKVRKYLCEWIGINSVMQCLFTVPQWKHSIIHLGAANNRGTIKESDSFLIHMWSGADRQGQGAQEQVNDILIGDGLGFN